jgi:hypothetical protein
MQALIEGLGIALQKMTAPPPPGSPFPAMAGMPGPPGPPGTSAPEAGMPPPGYEASGQAAADGDGSKGFWSWFSPGGSEKPAEVRTCRWNLISLASFGSTSLLLLCSGTLCLAHASCRQEASVWSSNAHCNRPSLANAVKRHF